MTAREASEHRLVWLCEPYGVNKVRCALNDWSAGTVDETVEETRKRFQLHVWEREDRKEEIEKERKERENKMAGAKVKELNPWKEEGRMEEAQGVMLAEGIGTAVTKESALAARMAGEAKGITCPECKYANPVKRMTCEICGTKLRTSQKEGEKMEKEKVAEMKKQLFEANKRLKDARKLQDPKAVKVCQMAVAKMVKGCSDVFGINEEGYAIQKKADGVAKAAKPKKLKTPKICPCCNGETSGGFFIMGHDGRVHGQMLKVKNGKMKVGELAPMVQKMYAIWSKNTDLGMRAVAEQLSK
jgi:hypothetical protein